MNQADVTKLVSKLRIKVNPRLRKLRNIDGPEGRLLKLRKTVTALIKYERIELYYNRANEARMYAERLISEAIRHGDTHKETMEMVDFWMLEKQLVHKVFKVLAPRYKDSFQSYTKVYNVPVNYPEFTFKRSVLELCGNPYPPLVPDKTNKNLIHNVLLDEAKKQYRMQKYMKIAEEITEDTNESKTE